MLRPRRIFRYVLRELATPSLLSLAFFTFLLLMNHFFFVASQAISKNLPAGLTLQMFLVGIPLLLVLTIPMSVLLGSLIGLGRMCADQEWIALQSVGYGLRSLYRPVLFHGLLGAVACFLVYNYAVPWSSYLERTIRGRVVITDNLAADLRARSFYPLGRTASLYVEDIVPGVDKERLRGVLLALPPSRDQQAQLFLARAGDLYPDPDAVGGILVDLYDGEARSYGNDPDTSYKVTKFSRAERRRFTEPFPALEAFLGPPQKPTPQNRRLDSLFGEVAEAQAELDALRAEIGTSPASRGRLLAPEARVRTARIELHRRFALPVACLLFAFLSIPLGLTFARSGKGSGFAVALMVIVLYRIVFMMSQSAANQGKLSPVPGVWAANAVILVLGCLALYRFGRPRSGSLQGWLLQRLSGWSPRRRSAAGAPAAPPEEPGVAEEMAEEMVALGGSSARFIGLLDTYVIRSFLRILTLTLAATYLIFCLVSLQSVANGVLRNQKPIGLVFDYYTFYPATIFSEVLPISCLIAAVVTYTLLSRSSELVAMMASGVGLRRATVPVLGFTLLLCGALYVVQDRVSPAAQRKVEQIEAEIDNLSSRTRGAPIAGRWNFGPEGEILLRYDLYDPTDRVFHNLHLFTLDRSENRPQVVEHRFCERARWEGKRWEVSSGWVADFRSGEFVKAEGTESLDLKLPRDLVDRQLKTLDKDLEDQLSQAELTDEIARLEAAGYDSTRMRVAAHNRRARTLAPFVMVLLGLPFAFRIGRRGSLYGIGVALLLVLVYWATFAVFNALGLEGLLPPPVAGWTPNLLFGLLGTYLMLYVRT